MAQLNPQTSELDAVTGIGKAVGDPLRATILVLLREDSFSVSELCAVLEVPQPALSHHLKILLQAGLIARRREASNLFYRRDNSAGDPLKLALFTALDNTDIEPWWRPGMERVHTERSLHCREFFARNAADIASLQTQIAEPEAYCETVLDMARRVAEAGGGDLLALEVGPGEGHLINGLARHYKQVHGVDSSAAMLARTAAASATLANVTLHNTDFFEFQPDRGCDLIVAAMTLHHLPSPAAFFAQARRLLNPGGSLIIAELRHHDQHWASDVCGDLWLGFEPAELAQWATNAGLTGCESQFLAQKNGFQIQIQHYRADQPSNLKEVS